MGGVDAGGTVDEGLSGHVAPGAPNAPAEGAHPPHEPQPEVDIAHKAWRPIFKRKRAIWPTTI